MYATIPHYRLKAFHEFLMTREEYREQCQVVDNYVIPTHSHTSEEEERNPTVVEVLGPEYACTSDEIHIDDTVLDNWEVEGKDSLIREGRFNEVKVENDQHATQPIPTRLANRSSESDEQSLAS